MRSAPSMASAGRLSVNSEQRQALVDYGVALGMSFQLVDDALDYSGDGERCGKRIGSDLAEGKVTLPLLLLREHLDAATWQSWQQRLRRPLTAAAAGELAELVRVHATVDACRERAAAYSEAAAAGLRAAFAGSPLVERLLGLAAAGVAILFASVLLPLLPNLLQDLLPQGFEIEMNVNSLILVQV